MNINHFYISSVLYKCHQVVEKGKKVNFSWVPCHIETHGKEKAVMTAKSTLHFEVTKFKVPYTDLKCFIKFYTNSRWQKCSDFCDKINFIVIKTKQLQS